MKLLNELLSLSEAAKGTTLVGHTTNGKLVTNETKDEVWIGDFSCSCSLFDKSKCNLESLKGAPKKVDGNFYCSSNPKLASLEGAPEEVTRYFDCNDNPNLTSLKGCPKKIGQGRHGGGFGCDNNPKITSLKDIHKQITNLGGIFIALDTPIKSNVLGLLLNGCTGVKLDNKKVEAILNKYLPNTRGNKGLIECQSELLDADLDDFAEL